MKERYKTDLEYKARIKEQKKHHIIEEKKLK
jgi:hypothetical protein